MTCYLLLGIQRESERTNRDPLNGMLLAPIGGRSGGVIPPPSPTHLYDSGEQNKEQEENPEPGRSQAHALDLSLDSDDDEGRLTVQTPDVTSPGMINAIHTRALGFINTSSTTAGGRPVNIGSQRRPCDETAVVR
jgi:hypothetical protein